MQRSIIDLIEQNESLYNASGECGAGSKYRVISQGRRAYPESPNV